MSVALKTLAEPRAPQELASSPGIFKKFPGGILLLNQSRATDLHEEN